MKNALFVLSGVFITLFVVMAVTIVFLHVMWLAIIILVLGAIAMHLHLRDQGYSWDRALYRVRLFIYRRL